MQETNERDIVMSPISSCCGDGAQRRSPHVSPRMISEKITRTLMTAEEFGREKQHIWHTQMETPPPSMRSREPLTPRWESGVDEKVLCEQLGQALHVAEDCVLKKAQLWRDLTNSIADLSAQDSGRSRVSMNGFQVALPSEVVVVDRRVLKWKLLLFLSQMNVSFLEVSSVWQAFRANYQPRKACSKDLKSVLFARLLQCTSTGGMRQVWETWRIRCCASNCESEPRMSRGQQMIRMVRLGALVERIQAVLHCVSQVHCRQLLDSWRQAMRLIVLQFNTIKTRLYLAYWRADAANGVCQAAPKERLVQSLQGTHHAALAAKYGLCMLRHIFDWQEIRRACFLEMKQRWRMQHPAWPIYKSHSLAATVPSTSTEEVPSYSLEDLAALNSRLALAQRQLLSTPRGYERTSQRSLVSRLDDEIATVHAARLRSSTPRESVVNV